MVAVGSQQFHERFPKLICGHWLDSIGNSIIVSISKSSEERAITAVLTPLVDHPEARDRVLTIYRIEPLQWRCGNATLEFADEQPERLVWVTENGRRSVWKRGVKEAPLELSCGVAFPWLLNNTTPEPWLPLDVPRDILYDGARIAALLDIRQLIGSQPEPQERLTHILMDHDLHPARGRGGDYLIPSAESPLWKTLPVPLSLQREIAQRIHRVPHEAFSQRISWNCESEVHVGHHKISCRARDIQALQSRWMLSPKDERKSLEIARLLALYSVFDNPLSNRRSGVHLGLDPELRKNCDYELFASPLNAAVANGHFASKWAHIEWRFGSIGSYPLVLNVLPVNSVLCVNPPFTEAYLADVMARLAELKLRFRLRIAMPIHDMPWRKKLVEALPSPQLLCTYYDATLENQTDVLHPTLLWEDPRCAIRRGPAAPLLATSLTEMMAFQAPAPPTWLSYQHCKVPAVKESVAARIMVGAGDTAGGPCIIGTSPPKEGAPARAPGHEPSAEPGTPEEAAPAHDPSQRGEDGPALDAREWPALSKELLARRPVRTRR